MLVVRGKIFSLRNTPFRASFMVNDEVLAKVETAWCGRFEKDAAVSPEDHDLN